MPPGQTFESPFIQDIENVKRRLDRGKRGAVGLALDDETGGPFRIEGHPSQRRQVFTQAYHLSCTGPGRIDDDDQWRAAAHIMRQTRRQIERMLTRKQEHGKKCLVRKQAVQLCVVGEILTREKPGIYKGEFRHAAGTCALAFVLFGMHENHELRARCEGFSVFTKARCSRAIADEAKVAPSGP